MSERRGNRALIWTVFLGFLALVAGIMFWTWLRFTPTFQDEYGLPMFASDAQKWAKAEKDLKQVYGAVSLYSGKRGFPPEHLEQTLELRDVDSLPRNPFTGEYYDYQPVSTSPAESRIAYFKISFFGADNAPGGTGEWDKDIHYSYMGRLEE